MDVYKANIQSYGSLDKPKLRILVRIYLQNKELVGYTWSPTSSMRSLKNFLEDATEHKEMVHKLEIIRELLQANIKNRVFVKLESKYIHYFPEYSKYIGRSLILFKSMYGITNANKLFADELTEWLLEAGFIQSQFQMPIYYKYAQDG